VKTTLISVHVLLRPFPFTPLSFYAPFLLRPFPFTPLFFYAPFLIQID